MVLVEPFALADAVVVGLFELDPVVVVEFHESCSVELLSTRSSLATEYFRIVLALKIWIVKQGEGKKLRVTYT